MDLDEFAVGVIHALLKKSGLRGAGADDGICGAAEDSADSAGAEDDRVGRENFHLHGAEVHGGEAAADACVVEDGGGKCTTFQVVALTFGFVRAGFSIA